MLDHGITEKIIRPKATTVITSTHFWVPVSRCSVAFRLGSRSSAIWSVVDSSSVRGIVEADQRGAGSRRTFAA